MDFEVVNDAGRLVWRVLLDPDEQDGAAAVGRTRHRTSQLREEHPAYGCKPADAEKIHVIGACGEWAVARALGLPFPDHIDTHGEPDLPLDIQVRCTSLDKDRTCRVFKRDQRGQRYVLVRRLSPTFSAHGNHGKGYFMVTNPNQPVTIMGTLRCPTCKTVPDGLIAAALSQNAVLSCAHCSKVAAFLAWVQVDQVMLGDSSDAVAGADRGNGNLRRFTED